MFLLLFNHSGTGSYMGFYYDLNDAGTYFDVVSQNPITHIENYYCPLNMFLCRIIRFLAKDKPPLKR